MGMGCTNMGNSTYVTCDECDGTGFESAVLPEIRIGRYCPEWSPDYEKLRPLVKYGLSNLTPEELEVFKNEWGKSTNMIRPKDHSNITIVPNQMIDAKYSAKQKSNGRRRCFCVARHAILT